MSSLPPVIIKLLVALVAIGSAVAGTQFVEDADTKAALLSLTFLLLGWIGVRRPGDSAPEKPGAGGINALLFIPGLSILLCLGACTPAQWQAQRDVATTAAVTLNTTVLPILEDAYRTHGKIALASADSAEQAQAALNRVREQWKPIWAAWDAAAEAHGAWATALEAEGDVLATAARARESYCRLRQVAPTCDVHLPQFPIVPCPS